MFLSNIQPDYFIFTILITLLALLQTFVLDIYISFKKFKHGVLDPEAVDNQDFKKVYKMYNNTVGDLILFLPLIWIFALIESDRIA